LFDTLPSLWPRYSQLSGIDETREVIFNLSFILQENSVINFGFVHSVAVGGEEIRSCLKTHIINNYKIKPIQEML